MQKKNSYYYFLGILTGVLIIPGIFNWLGIPTYDKLLEMILGEATTFNRFLAICITITLIFIIHKLPSIKKKLT